MKMLFLDMDGVINSQATWAKYGTPEACHGAGDKAVCPELAGRLNGLIERGGVKVVMSSAWRGQVGATRRLLRERGIRCNLIGCTPRLQEWQRVADGWVRNDAGHSLRVHEILAWLSQHAQLPIESIVILDDDDDMDVLTPRLVQTDWRVGLQGADVERALEILQRPFNLDLEAARDVTSTPFELRRAADS